MQQAHVELIHQRGTSYVANCYFWCTQSGELPAPPADIDLDLAEKLVHLIW